MSAEQGVTAQQFVTAAETGGCAFDRQGQGVVKIAAAMACCDQKIFASFAQHYGMFGGRRKAINLRGKTDFFFFFFFFGISFKDSVCFFLSQILRVDPPCVSVEHQITFLQQ